jgi:hypothetical protein
MDRYNALKTSLTARKEKLFKENPKNLAKWELHTGQVQEAIKVANNAELAFKMMLPNDTRKLEYLQEESSYFTNQTFKECRRVVMLDYT